MRRNNRHNEVSTATHIYRIIVVLASIALLVVFLPRSGSVHYEFSIGKPWHDSPVIAKETFPLLKSDSLLKAERENAMKGYRPVFEMDPDVAALEIGNFSKHYDEVMDESAPEGLRQLLLSKLQELYEGGIVTADELDDIRKLPSGSITISVGNEGKPQAAGKLHTCKTAYESLVAEADSSHISHSLLQKCGVNRYIKENLSYDKERSESLLESVNRSVSKYKGEIQAGQEIVHRGQIVDQNTYLALSSMETFYNNGQKKSRAEKLCQAAGNILYVAIIVVCIFIFFSHFRSDYLRRNNTVLFVTVMALIFPLITFSLAKHVATPYISFVVPYCIVPIFVSVFMDSRTAFFTHLSVVLLSAVAVPYHFEFLFTEVVAGFVAVFSMKQLSQRSELFATIVFITMGSLLAYFSFDLANMVFFSDEGLELTPYYLILGNGVLLSISYLLLFPIERIFKFTSNVTLIELSNTNNEILRRLSEEAPGTFQHSMQVANLAAEVANKIGANSQLVRTGALYHDIGKIENPAFFTENQSGNNPHDDLTFVHSARIIIAHVTNGLTLAEKYKLPSVITDFISTHHGTSKAKYFYISQKKKHPGEEIDEKPFTYPGPHPRPRAQAILKMADAVEASSRSLKEYTGENVNELVDRIVDTQVQEGYFNECPITFQAIGKAKSVFKDKLKTIYHTRITYPELGDKR
ncbi:MAG: HDIG domain-containing protein [Prevotellaceae bacterium]|nr:HDIG domain-containing protein [Prevotellaceae bacterium]